jgi:hypothetical protein
VGILIFPNPAPRACQENISRSPLTHSPKTEFSPPASREILFQLDKIDTTVFESTASRVVLPTTAGNDQIEDFSHNSFSRNILPASNSRSIFCAESSRSTKPNLNTFNILPGNARKNIGGPP